MSMRKSPILSPEAKETGRARLPVGRLLAVFRRRGPDGQFLYSRADRRRVMQLMLVTLVPPARVPELSPRLQAILGELALAAGTQRHHSPKEVMRALTHYFRKNPPHPVLMRELNALLKSILQEGEGAGRLGQVTFVTAPSAVGLAPPAPACTPSPSPAPSDKEGGALSDRLLPSSLNAARKSAMGLTLAARRFR